MSTIAFLAGCGNAIENLSVGGWREMGQPQPPLPPGTGSFDERMDPFVVTTIVPGSGPIVHAGDLVKAHVTVTTVDLGGNTSNPAPQDIWVWTGRDSENPWSSNALSTTYGSPGGARPRAAFIGRQLHEQFEIHLDEGADQNTGDLPVRGIIAFPTIRLEGATWVKGRMVSAPEWPALALRGEGGGNPSARIEILEICPGARYYRRSATLSQFGLTFRILGDLSYANVRHGTLGWSAIEAQCPGPDGHVRFQAGPFYESDMMHDRHMLMDWSRSYLHKRPGWLHPDEWALETAATR